MGPPPAPPPPRGRLKAGANLMLPLLLLATSSAAVTTAAADGEGLDATHLVQNLEVVENAPPGTIIGRIGDGIGLARPPRPPFLLVSSDAGAGADAAIAVDPESGRVRTLRRLDRERQAEYRLSALYDDGGASVSVVVRVRDVDDNRPAFPASSSSSSSSSSPSVRVDIPENTPVGARRTLPAASDPDQGSRVQYRITDGNEDGAFGLDVSGGGLELVVRGDLDRERSDHRDLRIVASDAGDGNADNLDPSGSSPSSILSVRVVVQDLNDNPPVFDRQRYFAVVRADAGAGAEVARVRARDADAGANAAVRYSVNRRQSSSGGGDLFGVEADTGVVRLNRRLPPETGSESDRRVYEIVVVAKDGGEVAQEASAFVTIRVTGEGGSDDEEVGQGGEVAPPLPSPSPRDQMSLVFLGGRNSVPEDIRVGQSFARVLVEDDGDLLDLELTGSPELQLLKNASGFFLSPTSPLDFESASSLSATILARRSSESSTMTFRIPVEDVNEHPPVFDRSSYSAVLDEGASPGSLVTTVRATDEDGGGRVHYSLLYDFDGSFADWFSIDEDTGEVRTQTQLDCEQASDPLLTVVASDGGLVPGPLSATATLSVSVVGADAAAPVFASGYYEATLPEDAETGRCFLRVEASASECGAASEVRYDMKEAGADRFRVDEESGQVCLVRDLDREEQDTYGFTIVASGKGGVSTSAMVEVTVSDVNDNSPEFHPSDYVAKVRSRFPSGPGAPSVLTVRAEDPDEGDAGRVRYAIVDGDGTFLVDEDTGSISLARSISSGRRRDVYRFRVSAVDGLGRRSSTPAAVEVRVDDDDLTFHSPQLRFSVREDVSPYSQVGVVEVDQGGFPASSSSSSSRGRGRRLHVYDSNAEGFLSVDPVSGVLRTEARLDHERRPDILLNVRVEDEDDSEKESYCQVVVKVEDVNDNAPEFSGGATSAMVAVREDVDVGSAVYSARAVDADGGENGRITYSLGGGGEGAEFFRVDPRNGDVILARPLDREAREELTVTIQASDGGAPPLRSALRLRVRVHDANDHAPQFERDEYRIELSETFPTGTPLATLKARDADAGRNAKVFYRLEPENPYIAVLRNSGVLVLKQRLDREFRKVLELRVVASDRGFPPLESSAKVVLLISDRNDNGPSFDREVYSFTVKEGQSVGSTFGRVRASDGDEGDNGRIFYSLVRDGGGLFAVDGRSGKISTLAQLDREAAGHHELLVEASDGGEPKRTARVVVMVTVEDENDQAPRLVAPPDRSILLREDTTVGTVVGSLVAEDGDKGPGGRVTFRILDRNPLVTISKNGDVRLLRPLSAQKQQHFSVLLSDGGNPSLTSEETISLVQVKLGEGDLQHPTTTSSRRDFAIGKSSSVGSKVGSAALKGEPRSFQYRMVTASGMEDFFAVDALSGDVFVAGDLAALDGSVNFDVEAVKVSGEVGPSMVRVIVDLTGEKDAFGGPPRFSLDPIPVTVDESVAVGSTVLNLRQFSAPDGAAVQSFRLVEQLSKDGSFDVSKDGVLSVAAALDYEVSAAHLLTVRAFTDGARHSADVVVVVNVTDVNDNAPKIILPERRATFSSNSPLHPTPLLSFLVEDADSGEAGQVRLDIVAGNEDATFALDRNTFHLSLLKPPIHNHYRLLLRATDRGSPPLFVEEELTVEFSRSRSSSKAFRQAVYRTAIQENAPPETKVFTIDLAGGSRGKIFTLMKGDLFRINESTGEIYTTVSLDREAKEEHTLVVGLVNPRDGRAEDTAVVYVSVDDVNDNAPRFSQQTCRDIFVQENSPNTYVHAFVAEDPDLGENGRVSYSLAGGDDVTGFFRIERDTGKLHSLPLDREEKEEHRLEVIAIDHGPERLTSRCIVTAKVMDVNDNDPSFTQSIYSASVREDIAIGTEVVRVSATDPDKAENARIRYSLENATHWAFAIDERTGAVHTITDLDRESVPEMRFDVVAKDGGRASIRSSRTQVKIIVTDANDHIPTFVLLPFRVNMTATPSTGVPLLRLSALDPDAGPNGHLTYNIVRPEQRERFHLSPEEGLLTVASSDIAWEPGTVETLEVAVSDAGSPPRSSTGLVQILIEGGPAVALTFQQESYHAVLAENPLSGTDVLQVRAVRSDGRRQRVIYSFLRGNELQAFEINSNNGLIRVRDSSLVDFERQEEFNLTVVAKALADDSMVAYTTCFVKLQDMNDHAPKFTREVYNVKVLEGNVKGSKVVQTKAIDRDLGQSEELRYEIIDGNVDGAFAMDPDNPGILLTNIILDREIRDSYELTISATDPGTPSLVGLAQVLVKVIDINDNSPHFAPVRPVVIDKNSRTGTAVATLRANDIDLAPEVTYRLAYPNEYLTVDVSTGQLILLRDPPPNGDAFKITAIASDSVHEATVDVEVSFRKSDRRCRRMLSKPIFNLLVSYEERYPATAGNVDVVSCGVAREVAFEVQRKDQSLFSVLPNGTVVVHAEPEGDVTSFLLTATDSRTKTKSNAVVTIIKTSENVKMIEFAEDPDTLELASPSSGDTGQPLAKLRTNQDSSVSLFFSVSDNPFLSVDSYSGNVYHSGKKVPSSSVVPSEVTVTVKRLSDMQSATKVIRVVGENRFEGSSSRFVRNSTTVTLSEDAPLGTHIRVCDYSESNGDPFVRLVSGNEDHVFAFDAKKLRLTLSKKLSFVSRPSHHAVLRMGGGKRFSLCKVVVRVEKSGRSPADQDERLDVFPLQSFVTSVAENAPPGTPVRGPPLLPLPPSPSVAFWTESKTFAVHSLTGAVTTLAPLDYEVVTSHSLTIFANVSGRVSECFLEIVVVSVDEFSPAFEQPRYYFAPAAVPNVGEEIGRVSAKDRDKGADGFVSFGFSGQTKYFSVDKDSGVIRVLKKLDTGVFEEENSAIRRRRKKRSLREVRLTVKARSRQPNSMESTALVTIALDETALPAATVAGSMPRWALVMLVVLLLLLVGVPLALFFFVKKRKKKEEARKNNLLATGGISNPNMSMEMSSSSDALSRFPPQYSEIVSDYERAKGGKGGVAGLSSAAGGNPRSEVSEKSHRSASSGRGSVEDGEEEVDVEIRMINEGNFLGPDSPAGANGASFALDEPDKASEEGSVQNTEEYLARLGIDVRKPPNLGGGAGEAMSQAGYENNYGGSSIYNRIPDDTLSEKNSVLSGSKARGASAAGGGGGGGGSLLYGSHHHHHRGPPSVAGSLSSVVHSEEELAGSYNWDYLLDWGPQYQPMAHVFKEISRLKDDSSGGGGGLSVSATTSAGQNHPTSPLSLRNLPHTSHLFRPAGGRSPISHDASSSSALGGGAALSPSFHPALSPLATKSPSVSPLSVPMQKAGNIRQEAMKNLRL